MFSTITLIASAALLASAAPFHSHSLEQRDPAQPANWWSGLEDYNTYHLRYMALDCEDQHSSTFFTTCCHPLLKNESLEKDRPAMCNPANDCDDDNEPEAPKPAPAAKPSPAAPKPPVNVAPAPKPAAPKPPVNVAPAPKPAPAPAPKPAPAAPAPKPAPAPASNPQVHTGGFGTWFTQNGVAGACGTVHDDSVPLVALTTALYDNGAHCGKTVSITDTDTKKTTTAIVADECPTCSNDQCLDMSTGLFTQFASLPVGQINIVWNFV